MKWTTIGEKWPSPNDFKPEENPFKRDTNGAIKSVAAISTAIRQDNARARAMCRSAGEPLSAWFPDNPK